MIALILGGAACLDDDVRAFRALGVPETILIAVNDAGCAWPHVDHWVTLHPEEMDAKKRRRAENGLPPAGAHWSFLPHPNADHWHRGNVRMHGGSSGLLAVGVALDELAADRVVLCGMPMDGQPNKFTGKPWRAHTRHRPSWERSVDPAWGGSADRFAPVRSMSGWTRELLGEPTAEWLREGL